MFMSYDQIHMLLIETAPYVTIAGVFLQLLFWNFYKNKGSE